jgi:hypothetical protein
MFPTVPASEFIPHHPGGAPSSSSSFSSSLEPHATPQSQRAEALHRIWRRVHGQFVLPRSACDHAGGWDVYDADMAGCRLCGAQHVCSDGSCATQANEQGHRVCPVTGLCVRTLNFSEVNDDAL